MDLSKSFNFVADKNAELLILGSMPGVKSLEENQYYAHPRNIFWNIIGDLLGFDRDKTIYKIRLEILKQNRIALWDVVSQCRRPGSLDSKIDMSSVAYNDFEYFFDKYRKIKYIVFNGRKAENLFTKYFSYQNLTVLENINFYPMPSTSPANASIKMQDKLNSWLNIKTLLKL